MIHTSLRSVARLSVSLFLAMAFSSSWASDDGLGPLPHCKPPGNEAIELHVSSKSNRERNLRHLAAMLSRDGFTVLFIENGSSGLSPAVSIKALPSLFRRVFAVRLENSAWPRSASDGFYCQLRVVRSVIPKRYRGLVDDIQAPDPQVY
jgi:hypothetical protein